MAGANFELYLSDEALAQLRTLPKELRQRIRALHEELAALNQRVEDLEDLRELNQAMERQGNKPLVPWAKAKKELGLA